MADQKNLPRTSSGPAAAAETQGDYLQNEYRNWQTLFEAQPVIVQQYLQAQARQLADALVHHSSQLRFTLPDRLVVEAPAAAGGQPVPVPADQREQLAGGLLDRFTGHDGRAALRQRLSELEGSPDRAVAVGAGLIRHATAVTMVRDMLPAGRSVRYIAAEGEGIPTIPVADELEPESAITAPTDAIAEEEQAEAGRGELLVPFVPAARRFYLPQWVAFGENDQLLVNSLSEAEAYLASMQRFMEVLHTAVSLAPYIIVDELYQQKRYGMLGQLVNQGRALARTQTREIIQTIKRRAAAQDLNRGLSLSLPYFDDQTLELKMHNFEVIPSGRIMFVPAFVVRASRLEGAKVEQDTRLSASTRQHLLAELHMLEGAFTTSALRSTGSSNS
ncbi:MAG: hypothetical protein L0332_25855 [Chloroflexi bacterium]|nr:hypothetical protein [Chloroflexota bacterium]MCI0645720.1 hypothetical protein [Chloroflexota bacterium]MCI0730125.1 hypothetical protein [Chloroflexota bacterium]